MFLNGIRLTALSRARVHLRGYKRSYSSTALIDTSVRMTLINNKLLAEEVMLSALEGSLVSSLYLVYIWSACEGF
jgi:hypothetical protein